MIRVLQFGMSKNKGGIETFIFNNYANIDRSKVQFNFVKMFDGDMPFQEEILQMGGRIIEFHPCGYKKDPKKNRSQWIELYQNAKPDIVHYNTIALYTLRALRYAKKAGITHVHVHAHPNRYYEGMSIVQRIVCKINSLLVYRYIDEGWACSDKAGKWAFAKKYKVIPNAIDTKRFSFSRNKRNELRKNLGIEGKYVIGHTGILSVVKNQSFLLKIFQEYHKKDASSVLLLLGSGPLRSELEKTAEHLGIQENVMFVGNVNNVEDYLSAMDLFVFPSLSEGFGIALIEAQANGLRCVVSSEANVPEVNITGGVERISLKKSVSDWTDKLFSIKEKGRMLDQSLTVLRQKYDITNTAKELETLYLNECFAKE